MAAAGAVTLGADGFAESYRLELKRVEIGLRRLPQLFDGFTIAQLSDFHFDDRYSAVPIRKSVAVVNDLHPDLIVLTGDFVTMPMFKHGSRVYRESANHVFPCAEALQHLAAPLGKYAILGNHDAFAYPGLVSHALQERGIPVLDNAAVAIERGKSRFWLAGIADALEGRPDLEAATKKIASNEAIVLLAHEPDFADNTVWSSVDLQLSGHSHGGQIWIPGIGAPWLPPLGRKYPRGLYKIGKLTLYTNIGIGTIRAPIRINCAPEITLITLRAAQA